MAEKPEDLNLPASVVTRIIKEAIPEGVNISKDAKTAMSRAASVFILYATTCANTHAMKGKRKTILPNDLFQALADMELEEFLPELKESLEVYKKDQKDKKQAAANRKLQKAANEVKSSENQESMNNEEPVEMDCSVSDNPVQQVSNDCPIADNLAQPVQHDPAVTVDLSIPLVLNS